MDELSERGRELLRRVLSRGRVAYDSLSEDERKAVYELVRLGYVKLYLEPNSGRIADAVRIVGYSGAPNRRFRRNHLCLALVPVVSLILLYLSIRSFIMGYAPVGVFFLLIDVGITYITYLLLRRHCL
ncbi:hypothetical protein [Vulcanisaeta souniana]|uniref:Uncharacterized protein n=1 Tax=Vulcanisaeta souniana JCM 11219 TaxID=1293586 RepID=A0A830E1W4_9CREN|nr:hypothetical protein [Vulcanisaeta souniana]BDR92302.1 hypothetical protein Vsou_13950 [Vulcanisaeta souniana JCM 11219]GGI74545.1 hypothetical protein GCM10007112_09120 [Vulcanisaeta souniana JCM 11219]